ncbi:MAG: Bug family tripartite tricarboxylate transporter substrate binding protein [Dongiaceae bacterium]
MKFPIRTLLSLAFVAGLTIFPSNASAEYPERAVHITVPFAAGGGSDTFVRQLAQSMSEHWSQPVLVENRPGASSQIGTSHVARTAPDGYNLLFVSNPFTANPGLFKSLPYDTERDFAPITMMATAAFVMVAHPSLGVNNVQELIALAKEKPGVINFASSGIGGPDHLAMELFKYRTGTDMVHVPFKGTGEALPALLSGEPQVFFGSGIASLPYIESGALKVLAVSSAQRLQTMPDVPTVNEAAGIDGFDVVAEYGMVAPAGTPPEIIDAIRVEIAKCLEAEEMQKLMKKSAAVKVANSPEEFAKFIQNEIKTYAELIKTVGISIPQ